MSRRRGYPIATNKEQAVSSNRLIAQNTNENRNGASQHDKSSFHASQSRPIFPSTAKIYQYTKSDYKKGQKAFPPPESLYLAKDTQVDPCFLRTTTIALNNLPRKTNIPIAVWVTPFANERVNVVQVRAPLRCSACKAYVNPYFQFDGTRRAASCNLCGIRFPIDENVDKINLQSAELATQSIIDFRVSEKIYFKKRTDMVKVMIAVELSMNTLELNIFSTILSSLKSVFQSHQFQPTVRIAIVFYCDNGVGFLQKNQINQKPVIFLAPNNKVNMNCCPLSEEEMFFDPNKQQEQLISSLQFLEDYGNSHWKQGKFSHLANYIHAIKSIKECFEQQTGKILLFSCLDPRWGTCALKNRSEQEQKLPLKATNTDIYQLGRELTRARIGVDHFYFSKDNLASHDLATTHYLSSITGGQLHLYSTFNNQSANALYYQIFHSLTRKTFYDIDFTCRVSPGLNVVRYGVPQGLREARDVALSTVNSSSSFLIELQQQEKLDQSKGAFLQFALLYTNCKNQRRIRVINFKFDVTSRVEVFYDSIDYLTLANTIARSYSQLLLKTDHLKVRQEGLVWLASLISEFQNKCQQALSVRIAGVVVPQGMGWALYYLKSIMSSQLFLKNNRQSDDLRMHQYLRIQADSPYLFASHHYPRLYPLTLDIYDQQPLPGDFLQTDNQQDQKIAILPTTQPLTRESIRADGVYLYDGCEQLVILVQPQAGEELLNDLFGTTNWQQIQSEGLPQLQTAHNIRVNNIIGEIRRRNTQHGGIHQVLKVKAPLKKKIYSDFVTSILKEDNLDSKFSQFMQLMRGAIHK